LSKSVAFKLKDNFNNDQRLIFIARRNLLLLDPATLLFGLFLRAINLFGSEVIRAREEIEEIAGRMTYALTL